MSEKNNPEQLNIQLTEEVAEGIYSNFAIITHSNTEFVVDFIRIMPGINQASVKSRIILTPEHAKRFFAAMQENIKQFESLHGAIDTREVPSIPMNFGGQDALA